MNKSFLDSQVNVIDKLLNDLRESVFRVVPIGDDFYAITYLSDDHTSIKLQVLNNMFTEATLDTLPHSALSDYAKLFKTFSGFLEGTNDFDIPDDLVAKAKMVTSLRAHRKDVDLFGIVDTSGKLL